MEHLPLYGNISIELWVLWENSHAYREIYLETGKHCLTFNIHSGQGVTSYRVACYAVSCGL
jgi:hypothetical protein